MYKPKSNQYYIENIQKAAGRVFCDKHTTRQAKVAINMISKRAGWALQSGSISQDEYNELMGWVNQCRSWIYA